MTPPARADGPPGIPCPTNRIDAMPIGIETEINELAQLAESNARAIAESMDEIQSAIDEIRAAAEDAADDDDLAADRESAIQYIGGALMEIATDLPPANAAAMAAGLRRHAGFIAMAARNPSSPAAGHAADIASGAFDAAAGLIEIVSGAIDHAAPPLPPYPICHCPHCGARFSMAAALPMIADRIDGRPARCGPCGGIFDMDSAADYWAAIDSDSASAIRAARIARDDFARAAESALEIWYQSAADDLRDTMD